MTEIATIESREIAPMDMLDSGQQASKALMEIVRHTKTGGNPIVVTISGNEYLKVEAWEFIGRANNTFAATDKVHAIVDENGDVQAYEAKVNLMKDGMIVGSAVAECGLDSFVTRGAQGRDKHNAAKSMAQTRATSKAFRMAFSWVAVLAGYSPTPAEEMQAVSGGTPRQQEAPADPEYWCDEHGEAFFKAGKMQSYAHKIDSTGKWHNMPETENAPERPQEAKPGRHGDKLPRQLTSQGFIDDCRKMGIDGSQVDEMFGGKDEIKRRIDGGETWEDLLKVVENVMHEEPPVETQEVLDV